jgi:lipopolysaccharide transport system ATP-binding protein
LRTEQLGKLYRTGTARLPYGRLSESISAGARRALRLERAPAERNTLVWALRNVSVEIDQGEVVGVIGPNGAGKTTLLKILTGITEPSQGRVGINGRVASLLEVGTGFHPELTGRENILLNGAILGMRRREIKRKFDDIVEFAETGAYLDTPVKRYSSGMYVRLAFAVAAHLEPEILLVDEVLAVGDADFQKRCLGKLGDVAQQGRTVVFVSHNMTAINHLCPRSLYIASGELVNDGPTADVIASYLRTASEEGERHWDTGDAPGNSIVRMRALRVRTPTGVMSDVAIDEPVSIEVDFEIREAGQPNLCINVWLLDATGTVVLSTVTAPAANALPEKWFGQSHVPGLYRARCEFPADFLNDGRYYVSAFLVTLGPVVVHAEAPEALSFTVFDTGSMRDPGQGYWHGVIRVRLPWTTELLEER